MVCGSCMLQRTDEEGRDNCLFNNEINRYFFVSLGEVACEAFTYNTKDYVAYQPKGLGSWTTSNLSNTDVGYYHVN
jgi:hypothetical protein